MWQKMYALWSSKFADSKFVLHNFQLTYFSRTIPYKTNYKQIKMFVAFLYISMFKTCTRWIRIQTELHSHLEAASYASLNVATKSAGIWYFWTSVGALALHSAEFLGIPERDVWRNSAIFRTILCTDYQISMLFLVEMSVWSDFFKISVMSFKSSQPLSAVTWIWRWTWTRTPVTKSSDTHRCKLSTK